MATLTRQQAEAVARHVHPMMGYVVRLRERMERVGFLPADPLLRAAREAEDGLRGLWVLLHYASCDGGVGEPRDGKRKGPPFRAGPRPPGDSFERPWRRW